MHTPSPGIIEPFGQDQPLSKLERVWDSRVPGTALMRERVVSFDVYSGLCFSPLEYRWEPIEYDHLEPLSEEWVKESFIAFVKGEFDENRGNPDVPIFPDVVGTVDAEASVYSQYMFSCEKTLLYPYANALIKSSEQDSAQALLHMLSDEQLGNKVNRKFANESAFTRVVRDSSLTKSRLLFVVPSFPFKDQNYTRTYKSEPSEFGFGEVALMIRLHMLSLAFYQVHPWGTDWLLAADGVFYARMFDVDESEALRYFGRLRQIRTRLNLQGSISMIDLTEIVDHYAGGNGNVYADDRVSITRYLTDIASSSQPELIKAFGALKRGMRQGQSTREFESRLTMPELWAACMWEEVPDNYSADAKAAHNRLDIRAKQIAIQYACENLLLRRHRVLDKVFPGNIRTTVHAKPGQIAVPKVGSCFPWNGVTFAKNGKSPSIDSMEVKRFYELGRHHKEVLAYLDTESRSVLFFSSAS